MGKTWCWCCESLCGRGSRGGGGGGTGTAREITVAYFSLTPPKNTCAALTSLNFLASMFLPFFSFFLFPSLLFMRIQSTKPIKYLFQVLHYQFSCV